MIDMPPLNRVINRVGVIFDGEEPETDEAIAQVMDSDKEKSDG